MSPPRLPWPERFVVSVLIRGEGAEFLVGDLVERWADDLGGGVAPAEARRRLRRNVLRTMAHWWKPSAVRARRLVDGGAWEDGRAATVVDKGGRGMGMGAITQDLRAATRGVARNPGLAFAVVVTLALGIGTTTTIFSVVEGVVLRPLPFRDPGTLVSLGTTFPGREWRDDVDGLMHLAGMSVANFVDLRARARSYQDLVAAEASGLLLPDRGEGPELVSAQRVSTGFFDLLGVTPALGRTFLPEEYADGAADGVVMLMSWGAWERRFGADPAVIGTALTKVGVPATIVGVLPRDFRPPEALFPTVPDFWMPLQTAHPRYADRGRRSVALLGRLRIGTTLEQARAEGTRIAAALAAEHPDGNVYPNGTWFGIGVNDLHDDTVGGTGRTLLIFLGASTLLLVLAVMNAAMLLLARALDRTRELGVRIALGARRGRVARMLLTEAGLLALLGGCLGVALAWGGIEVFVRFAPRSIPRTDMVSLNGWVLTVALSLSVGTGLAAGILPALRTAHRAPWEHLRGGGRTIAPADSRLRSWFVGGQLAIAVLLVSGAGLLLSSFARLVTVDPGFDATGLTSVRVDLKRPQGSPDEAGWQAWDAVLAEVSKVPGVSAVAGTTNPPFQSPFWAPWIAVPGDPPQLRREGVAGYAVTPGYFDAVGTRLLRGRDFEVGDGPDATRVAIVNEAFVRETLRGASPLGTTVWEREGADAGTEIRIVGVVEDVVQTRAQEGARPAIYFPYRQAPWPLIQVVVRSDEPAADVATALRQAVLRVNPFVPPQDLRTMEARMSATRTTPRFQTMLIGSLALVALLLAASGLYGAQAHAVGRRRRELGVRAALGAARPGILRMVVAQGMRIAVAGLAVGLAAALALTRVLSGFLFEVRPNDPLTYAGVACVLLLVALAASLVPALRATGVDPVEVLRAE